MKDLFAGKLQAAVVNWPSNGIYDVSAFVPLFFMGDQGDYARALGLYREALVLGRASSGKRVVFDVIEAVGIVAALGGQAERGARLLGAVEAQRARIGLRYRLAENQVTLDKAEAASRTLLGDLAFETAWAAGGELRLEDAIAEALTPTTMPAPPPQIVLEVLPGERFLVNKEPLTKETLGKRLKEIYDGRPEKIIFVKGDPKVKYSDVIYAMDVSRGAGVRVIGMSPKETPEAGL